MNFPQHRRQLTRNKLIIPVFSSTHIIFFVEFQENMRGKRDKIEGENVLVLAKEKMRKKKDERKK